MTFLQKEAVAETRCCSTDTWIPCRFTARGRVIRSRLLRGGGKLYGLGARDMKGGLAAILTALDSAGDQHIKVLICVDEENISKGAWKAVVDRRDWFNDVKLVVSGDGATSQTSNGGVTTVTLGRRGEMRCNYRRAWAFVPRSGSWEGRERHKRGSQDRR